MTTGLNDPRSIAAGRAAALAEVCDWLVSEFGFPFDFVTIARPPWLDIDALAHAWSRHDGESPEIYAATIRAETGWAE